MSDPASTKSNAQLLGDRRKKLQRLREEFELDPYGHRVDGLVDIAAARDLFDATADEAYKAAEDPAAAGDNRPVAAVAGRVVQHRVMGNLIFMVLRDHSGDIQVAVSKKTVGQPFFGLAKMTDYGDLVTAKGALGTTKTGEVSVWAGEGFEFGEAEPPYRIATKSLALPPGKHHGLTDAETRYRKRYVDLYSNPSVMQTMQLRIRIIDAIRDHLRAKGFVEVETPMLQSLHGGAAARPFHTHHNALDIPLTLRIAPELYLKRLLVGGMPKVFEINRNFRNEGVSPRHNPEFTMLEAYQAFGDWETMAELVEDMTCGVAQEIFGTLKIEHKSADGEVTRTIDLSRPWRRVSMAELVEERTGWKFTKEAASPEQIDKLREQNPGKDLKFDGTPAEQLTEVFEKLIEHTLIDPCFVTRVPSVIIPLAKTCADDDYFADVYELAINGVEISPGYTELNDPQVQEANFREQVGDEEEKQQIDEDFLEALKVGMPPAGGLGLGIDRLVMMLTGAESIRDVILFPLMKPQGDA